MIIFNLCFESVFGKWEEGQCNDIKIWERPPIIDAERALKLKHPFPWIKYHAHNFNFILFFSQLTLTASLVVSYNRKLVKIVKHLNFQVIESERL